MVSFTVCAPCGNMGACTRVRALWSVWAQTGFSKVRTGAACASRLAAIVLRGACSRDMSVSLAVEALGGEWDQFGSVAYFTAY